MKLDFYCKFKFNKYRNHSHERILKCYGWFEDDDKFYIVLKYFQYSLKDLLSEDSKRILSLEEKYIIAKKVAEGIMYLHSHQIVHRDIKSSNILIDDKLNVKIGDFGIAKEKSKDFTFSNTLNQGGSLYWMSPETIIDSKYSYESDIWSFEMLIYELLTGKQPFYEVNSIFDLMILLQSGKKPVIYKGNDDYSKRLNNIYDKCTYFDPKTRIDINKVLEIFNYSFKKDENSKLLNDTPLYELEQKERFGCIKNYKIGLLFNFICLLFLLFYFLYYLLF